MLLQLVQGLGLSSCADGEVPQLLQGTLDLGIELTVGVVVAYILGKVAASDHQR